MIAEVRQEKTNFDISYVIRSGGLLLGRAAAPFPQGRIDMNIQMGNNTYFFQLDPSVGGKLRESCAFRLYEDGRQIGRFMEAGKRTGIIFGYQYFQIQFRETEYQLYPVGFGRDGLYLCLYQGDRLVAMVDKELTTINFRDVYHLYLEREEDLLVLAAATLQYDVLFYGDFGEIRTYSKATKLVYATNNELISKYDPDFIPRIKQQL